MVVIQRTHQMTDHIPAGIQTILNIATPITAAGYLASILPQIALFFAALWSILQIINFIMLKKWAKWVVFKKKKTGK